MTHPQDPRPGKSATVNIQLRTITPHTAAAAILQSYSNRDCPMAGVDDAPQVAFRGNTEFKVVDGTSLSPAGVMDTMTHKTRLERPGVHLCHSRGGGGRGRRGKGSCLGQFWGRAREQNGVGRGDPMQMQAQPLSILQPACRMRIQCTQVMGCNAATMSAPKSP